MTNAMCTQFCFGKGFPYAGTEYSTECYCGDKIATGGDQKPAADCSASCGGNAAEPCGAGNRLTLYKTDKITGPSETPAVGNWLSMGCYSEGNGGRTLTYGLPGVPGAQMTIAKCTSGCEAAGYPLAGAEFGGECCKTYTKYEPAWTMCIC